MSNSFSSSSFTISWESDGFMRLVYHRDHEITPSDMEQMVEWRKTIIGEKRVPFMIITGRHNITINAAARDYSKKTAYLTLAGAVVSSSVLAKVLVNVMLTTIKPGYPLKVFSSEEKALAWLKKIIDQG